MKILSTPCAKNIIEYVNNDIDFVIFQPDIFTTIILSKYFAEPFVTGNCFSFSIGTKIKINKYILQVSIFNTDT